MQDKGSAHVTGCCIGCLPVDRLVINVKGKPFLFDFDSPKQAEEAGRLIGGEKITVEKKEDVLRIL